jgi:hypothetical protein
MLCGVPSETGSLPGFLFSSGLVSCRLAGEPIVPGGD